MMFHFDAPAQRLQELLAYALSHQLYESLSDIFHFDYLFPHIFRPLRGRPEGPLRGAVVIDFYWYLNYFVKENGSKLDAPRGRPEAAPRGRSEAAPRPLRGAVVIDFCLDFGGFCEGKWRSISCSQW